MHSQKNIVVDKKHAGLRLDVFIAQAIPDFSRSQAKKSFVRGCIKSGSNTLQPDHRVKEGEKFNVEIPPSESSFVIPEKIPLAIVYEDENLLVVDKPAGMVVHPAKGHRKGTLANALLGYLGEKSRIMGERLGIVHRLDKETSGLILVAKDEKTLRFLQDQFIQRSVKKKYLALAWGTFKETKGTVEAAIARHRGDRKKFSVSEKGRAATTHYRVIKRYRFGSTDCALLEVEPKTGRTHQIRVHLASTGHSIVGDITYSRSKKIDQEVVNRLGRYFLHASVLKIVLPRTKTYREFHSSLSPELQNFLNALAE